MNNGLKLSILIGLITLSEAFGQYVLKLSVFKNSSFLGIPSRFLPGLTWLMYGLCTIMLVNTYNYTSMAKAEVFWDAASAIIVPIIGVMAFNEDIDIVGWFGILLIIIGTIILGFEKAITKHLNKFLLYLAHIK